MKEVGIVALSTLVIYLFLAVLVRLLGRRTLGQLSALDLLILVLLGSSVETSMVHASTLLRMGFVSATVLILTNRLVAALMLKSKKLRHLVGAGPVLLIHNGKFVEDHIRKLGLTHADILQALRGRECAGVNEVRLAVMEPDGRINVVMFNRPAKDPQGLPAGGG